MSSYSTEQWATFPCEVIAVTPLHRGKVIFKKVQRTGCCCTLISKNGVRVHSNQGPLLIKYFLNVWNVEILQPKHFSHIDAHTGSESVLSNIQSNYLAALHLSFLKSVGMSFRKIKDWRRLNIWHPLVSYYTFEHSCPSSLLNSLGFIYFNVYVIGLK